MIWQAMHSKVEDLPPDLIEYLVRCALAEGECLEVNGVAYYGRMGLARDWLHRGLTEAEEQLLSSCLLALMNARGAHVEVSLRVLNPDVSNPFLQATDSEKREFKFFEGAFFGNLFRAEQPAFACIGQQCEDRGALLNRVHRVCTIPSGLTLADGRPLSLCNMVLVGDADEPDVFTQNGVRYAYPVAVYLRP